MSPHTGIKCHEFNQSVIEINVVGCSEVPTRCIFTYANRPKHASCERNASSETVFIPYEFVATPRKLGYILNEIAFVCHHGYYCALSVQPVRRPFYGCDFHWASSNQMRVFVRLVLVFHEK
jgi:hypothetical protein